MKVIIKNWNKYFLDSDHEPSRYQQEFECARRILNDYSK